MDEDLLAQFRRKGTAGKTPSPQASASADDRVYEAFNAKDNQRRGRLGIRRKGGMSHAPAYNYIIDICYDQDDYRGILLVLGTMLVKIRGRNLKPIVDALLLGCLAPASTSKNSATTSLTSPSIHQRRSLRESRL
jgi:hypothetical protein